MRFAVYGLKASSSAVILESSSRDLRRSVLHVVQSIVWMIDCIYVCMHVGKQQGMNRF